MELKDAKTISLTTHHPKLDKLQPLRSINLNRCATSIVWTLNAQTVKEGTPQNLVGRS